MALRTIIITAQRNQKLSTVVINRGPAGVDGTGGTNLIAEAEDVATVDLPALNGPLSVALAALGGGGSISFTNLTDATTADLPTINGPLGTALASKAPSSHTHTVSEITDFPTLANIATSGSWNDLSNVPSTFNPSSHTHLVADITDFPTLATVATSGSWNDLINVPSTFNPSSHTHTVSEITDFPTLANIATSGSWNDLSNVPSTFNPSSHTHLVADITDFPTLATVATSGAYADLTGKPSLVVNFGDLGDATTVNLPVVNTPLGTALSGKAPLSHTHTVSQITDFPTLATVATSGAYADLSGTPTIPSDSQVIEYLFDDGVHALISTSGAVTPNALDGLSQKLTLSENISSFNTPTNLADGQSMLVQISNSAYAFNLNPSWEIISGTAQQVSNSTRSRLAITRFGSEYWISIESQ